MGVTYYTHLVKGGVYKITMADASMKVEGVWVPAVVYQCTNSGKTYVRSRYSFDKSLKIIHERKD